jgi:hypothetical protein
LGVTRLGFRKLIVELIWVVVLGRMWVTIKMRLRRRITGVIHENILIVVGAR